MSAIALSFGKGVRGKQLTNRISNWDSFVENQFQSTLINMTRAQYNALPDEMRTKVKTEQPWVIAGPSSGVRGEQGALQGRTLVTIDIDGGNPGDHERVRSALMAMETCGYIHSTISHTPAAPRFRVVIPLKEQIDVDDYFLAARIFVSRLGLTKGVDPKSFVSGQIMFLPSHFIDDSPIAIRVAGEPWDALDELCAWGPTPAPRFEGEGAITAATIKGVENQEERGGTIGAFLKCYSAYEAIVEFLPGVYEMAENGRMRRAGSKSMGGLVFLDRDVYSHHSLEDPLARPGDDGKVHSHNAFDTVWLHRGGTLEEMVKWAAEQPRVKALLQEQIFEAIDATAVDDPSDIVVDPPVGVEADWKTQLEMKNGRLLPSFQNVCLLVKHKFPHCRHSLFDHLDYFGKHEMKDIDVIRIRHFLETTCEMPEVGERNLQNGVAFAVTANAYHPVRDYLNGCAWDGVPRIDRWLVDLIGAEDTEYVRTVGRLFMIGAVARIFEPGCKFDSCLVLVTKQGAGKGRFIRALAAGWHKELSSEFHSTNKMIESTQGGWLVEIAELAGVGRADRNILKGYITRQDDRARLAYARRADARPRQFVLIGSSNEMDFLADDTGERRWWPVEGDRSSENPIVVPDQETVSLMWAEAVEAYRARRAEAGPYGGLRLFLEKQETRKESVTAVEKFKAASPAEGLANQIAQWANQRTGATFTREDAWMAVGRGGIMTNVEASLLGKAMKILGGEWFETVTKPHGQRRVYVYSKVNC